MWLEKSLDSGREDPLGHIEEVIFVLKKNAFAVSLRNGENISGLVNTNPMPSVSELRGLY